MNKNVLLAVSLLLSVPILAQKPSTANTLLWRISGNQLTKPSYLYGTMHLTDKRVFQLGDSVYNAIEKSEGFAAELDMNRLGSQMLNQLFKDDEEEMATESVKVKDVISPETWEVYKSLLEEKFNKKADKITVDDLEELDSRLQMDVFKRGDMPTFLDAWLFGKARSMGKWVGGVEDFEDQVEHLNYEDIEEKIQSALYDDKYYRNGLDWFINVYNKQLLDSIDAFMYRENGVKDYIMIKRNVKMARRMDSLSGIRSTFFAVGVAHLPGDSGVIALLKGRGFDVTPVISSKKIKPEKYIANNSEAEWIPVSFTDSAYSLKMPGVAENFELLQSLGLDIKIHFDIALMQLYMTMGIELPEQRKKLGADSIYESLKKRYSSNGKMLYEKTVTVNGTKGREYAFSNVNGEFKMQIFLPEMQMVVLNMIYAINKKSLESAEAGKYFNSFVYNKNFERKVDTDKDWVQLDYPNLAFSAEMPIKPKETKDVKSDEGQISYAWQAIDIKNQVFYGMSVSVMKEGMFNEMSDTTYFLTLKNNLQYGFEDAKVVDSSFFSTKGFPSFGLTLQGTSDGQFLHTKVLTIIRGGLMYYLYAVYDPNGSSKPSIDRYFESFKLTPYKHPNWVKQTDPSQSFTTVTHYPITVGEEPEEDFHPGAIRHTIYDPIAGTTTFFDKTIIPEWLTIESDTAFLRAKSEEYTSWGDSIVDYKLNYKGDQTSLIFTVETPGKHLIKKVKLVVNGNELYEVFGQYANSDYEKMYYRHFDSLQLKNARPKINRSMSKASLFKILSSNPDLKTTNEIKYWWDYLSFNKEDIPSLQNLSLLLFPDFDSTTYGSGLSQKIYAQIKNLDSNHTTVDYIKSNYQNIDTKNEYVKLFIVDYLSEIQTERSYAVLKNCLLNYSLYINEDTYFSNSFYDSLQLTATLYPELFKLADHVSFWRVIAGTSTSLLDSNLISVNTIKENGSPIVATAKRLLETEEESIEEYAYMYTDLIRLLSVINSTESKNLLVKFSKFDNREIRFRTLLAMLANDQSVDKKTIFTLATTDEYRHQLYDELKGINKLKLFPSDFLNQQSLAKSKLYEYAEEEDSPSSITLAGEKIVDYKGQQQRFYLYRISYSYADDINSSDYLGIVGPYPLNKKDMNSSHEKTGIYWQEDFDKDKISEMLKNYLESDLQDEETDIPQPPPPQEMIKIGVKGEN